MGSLNFMVNRFTDIMKQTGTFRHAHVYTNFTGKQTGKLGYLNRMLQCILSIT